ncbi:Transcription factor bHLH96 [Platanthera zijinensis]|uniref:Transcription factor bHLH96 n=1 Tax=Platanthera zijinensis TaxID=2320716 RepID=A0AAP0BL50_9ASPA
MALEAVVFQNSLSCRTLKEMYSFGGSGNSWGWEIAAGGLLEEDRSRSLYANLEASPSSCGFMEWDVKNYPAHPASLDLEGASTLMAASSQKEDNAPARPAPSSNGRRKRRRTKCFKNKEEVENQRMTHIAVERNRRKQMNDYLALLRSLMPPSYAQKGDQASIIGGAINYVKELEQLLQSLKVQKQLNQHAENRAQDLTPTISPLASIFTFPQYSSTNPIYAAGDAAATRVKPSSFADIEVTMVESHASLKLLCRRRPKQLLRVVVGLQNLRLTALHLNVTSFDGMVLYSFNLKVEEDCQFTSGDDIAAAVHEIVWKVNEEDGFDG